jgi:hypothetical protein
MIGEIIATLGLIIDFAEDHPDIVQALAREARELLGGHDKDPAPGREAMLGLAAGMAASRADAVQRAARALTGAGDMDKTRAIVARWARKTTTRNQLLLQQDGVQEMCAELLRDLVHT